MLVIRKEQMEALSEAAFENWMLEHLKKFFPRRCATRRNSDLLKGIRLGVERSKQYGFEAEGDRVQYIDLMFALGNDFDRDPELPWAEEILNDESIPDAGQRMDRLHDAAVKHLRKPSTADAE